MDLVYPSGCGFSCACVRSCCFSFFSPIRKKSLCWLQLNFYSHDSSSNSDRREFALVYQTKGLKSSGAGWEHHSSPTPVSNLVYFWISEAHQ